MADTNIKLVQSQATIATISAQPSRADELAAAKDKAEREAFGLLSQERIRCMTGEEAASVRDFTRLDGSRFRLKPEDLCIARQEASVWVDADRQRYVTDIGIYSPYMDFMKNRGLDGTPADAKYAIEQFKAAVEKVRKGEWKETPQKIVDFIISPGIKPLRLMPGSAFDVGFVAKVGAVIDGKESVESVTRSPDEIRKDARACISNLTTTGSVACYDLGRENANRYFQENPQMVPKLKAIARN